MKNFITYLVGIIYVILIMVVSSFVLGFPFMWLWNWVVPAILGLTKITYWQSVCILMMTRILSRISYNLKN